MSVRSIFGRPRDQIDVGTPQRGQLTASQAPEDGEQDECTIPGVNDISEGEYLLQGKYGAFW